MLRCPDCKKWVNPIHEDAGVRGVELKMGDIDITGEIALQCPHCDGVLAYNSYTITIDQPDDLLTHLTEDVSFPDDGSQPIEADDIDHDIDLDWKNDQVEDRMSAKPINRHRVKEYVVSLDVQILCNCGWETTVKATEAFPITSFTEVY